MTTKTTIAYIASRPKQNGVGHVEILAVRSDGHADEAREVGAERENHDSDDHPGHEQHDLADQLGHRDQADAVRRDHQRGEDDQPVDQQAEHAGRVGLAAALLEERVDARLFR